MALLVTFCLVTFAAGLAVGLTWGNRRHGSHAAHSPQSIRIAPVAAPRPPSTYRPKHLRGAA
jgi:hypothetical protein